VIAQRFLIVNADDFGQTPGINRGIIQAHEQGIVTSASLMVRWPAAAAAAAYARQHPALSVGLHVDLGEWTFREGTWVQLYEVVPVQAHKSVADEVDRQLNSFRQLLGQPPTHLDSHQHVHHEEPSRALLAKLARQLGVPLRGFTSEVRYRGDFYGQGGKGFPCPQAISVDGLVSVLTSLPPGFTELGCHPGLDVEENFMYARERADEVTTLCHPQVRAALAAEGIRLCSFQDVPRSSLTDGAQSAEEP
jgi:predicted glycoside hydrolase/deacetylase ChbG (UPF0249 family)